MIFNYKKIVLTFSVFLATAVSGYASGEKANSGTFDWNPVMEAIIQVESRGNSNAISGIYCGAMQISPVLVRECNNILKSRNSSKRYTLKDRFSVEKSKEMFLLIQSRYNPTNNIEKAIRSWSGGINYKIHRTNNYYRKVLSKLK